MRLFGILLIALGAIALAYQGFTYVSRDTIVEAGPVKVTADRQHYVWLPPALGGAAVAIGALLLIGSHRYTE